jgi:predicted  nucleic acid-binding Zn-ribbon protein
MSERKRELEEKLKNLELEILSVQKDIKDYDSMIRETKANIYETDPLKNGTHYRSLQLECLYWLDKYSKSKDKMWELKRQERRIRGDISFDSRNFH